MGTSEKAQWVKVLATKPNKLSLVLRTHMVEGEKWSNKLSSDLNMHNMAQEYMYVCLHMLINLENKNNKNNCPWTARENLFTITNGKIEKQTMIQSTQRKIIQQF